MTRTLATSALTLALAATLGLAAPQARAQIATGAVAPNFTKTQLGGGSVSLSQYSGKVVVLFLFGYGCPYCLTDGVSVENDINDYYAARKPGQVQVLGADLWNGTPAQVQSFKNQTGATYPLLLQGAAAAGGNISTLYGAGLGIPYDNYLVINKQGIVRYHAALTWPHGNRYHLNEIRGAVDSLVSNTVGVEGGPRTDELSLSASPSPFRGSTRIELAIPGAGVEHARVAVHDVLGRRIASLWDGPAAGGRLSLEWNARGTQGALAAGIYVVTAQVGARFLQRKVVHIP